MCGIAGIAGPRLDRARLEAMTLALRHRGPDDSGVLVDGQTGLGHRRLAIIDPAGGHQPMTNEDGSVWVILNGEIFNFPELRDELVRLGHVFKSRSDTEVIVHGYEEWGVDVPRRLRGEFAFAVYDAKGPRLLLARDRFGIKPLVYAEVEGTLVFASEIKALLASGLVPIEIDPVAIHHYLTYGYILHPRTAFRRVRKLEPATALVRDLRDGSSRCSRYWDLVFEESSRMSFEDSRREVLRLLREAVEVRMISDVPLGAFLSGGVDSSAVVALMSQRSARPVKTFTIGFAEAGHDERQWARLVADRFGTDHHDAVVASEDLVRELKHLVRYYDEPFADSSAVPTYFLSRLARQHVVVALSGDGSDELFVGYPRYRRLQRLAGGDVVPAAVRRGISRLAERLPEPPRRRGFLATPIRLARALGAEPVQRFLGVFDYFSEREKRDLYDPAFLAQVEGEDSADVYAHVLDGVNGISDLNRFSYLELMTYIPGDINPKVDIASMRNSLEVRVPFLDHHLVEFVARLPFKHKMRGSRTKHLLKEAMRGLLPDEVLSRHKMGFELPLSDWLRGPLLDWSRELLLSSAARSRGVLRPDVVARTVEDHQSGRQNLAHVVWALLVLEQWFRLYVDHERSWPPAGGCAREREG